MNAYDFSVKPQTFPTDAQRNILQKAFELVQNPDDWKAPIDSTCPDYFVELVKAAVEFFTATTPTFTDLGNHTFRVVAVGYRNGPAGDH